MKTVSRIYDTHADARAAVSALEEAGVPSKDISLVANTCVSAELDDGRQVPRRGHRHRPRHGAGRRRRAAGRPRHPDHSRPRAGGGGGLAGEHRGRRGGGRRGRRHRGRADRRRPVAGTCRRLFGSRAARLHAGERARGRSRSCQDPGDPRPHGPVDPVQRASDYRREGWTCFDPKAPAYTPSETEIERIRRDGTA